MCSSDRAGVGKNYSGERDDTVMLYALSSFFSQSLPDLVDWMVLAIATPKSEDIVGICAPKKTLCSLGARMHLSRVYMVITLWFFKHFTQQKTPGYMLSFFEKKTPLWSPCTQGSNCDYIWKKTPLWSQCTQQSHGDCIWKENSTKTSGFFVKENPSFFHNFVYNVSTLNLSHSLRLLS